jgi:hypothetical protein
MSDPHTGIQSEPGHGPSGVQHGHGHGPALHLPFTDAEWHEFRESDKRAGGAIVVLMTSIFTTGLLLYTVVAISAY